LSEPPDILDPVVANILEAATREFAQYGFGGARLERIIANTRTSKRMVYYHFASKEGLYRAVLEHAFDATRLHENSFDPTLGTPLETLVRFAVNAFDSLVQRPDFVRLLTMENLSGAPYIQDSALISRINQRGLDTLAAILRRGQQDGSLRSDISALDLYINLVGLCVYHVSNYAGWLAGFKGQVNAKLRQKSFHQARKRAVIEATTRYACTRLADLPPQE
jgi:AcrR family transcriptional regulator